MTNAPPASGAPARLNGRVFFGIGLALLGIAMLTDPRDHPGIYLPAGWWPVFVILFGMARLVDPGEREGKPRSRRAGAWILGIGIWGLVSETRLLGFGYGTSWPLLVILVGISIVWRALEQPASCRVR
jgi:hypothetical protein